MAALPLSGHAAEALSGEATPYNKILPTLKGLKNQRLVSGSIPFDHAGWRDPTIMEKAQHLDAIAPDSGAPQGFHVLAKPIGPVCDIKCAGRTCGPWRLCWRTGWLCPTDEFEARISKSEIERWMKIK
jgi:hypothetical protein